MPQVGQDADAPLLQHGRLRVLVFIDHVLVRAFGHQQLRMGLHPGGDERGQVEPGVAVEHQLVVDELPRGIGRDRVVSQRVQWWSHLLGQDGVGHRHERIPAPTRTVLIWRPTCVQCHPLHPLSARYGSSME